MSIIDTHVHLDHLPDPETALKEAREAGVEAIVAVGVDLAANQKNLEFKKGINLPVVYLACGIHPGNIKSQEVEECFDFIRRNRGEIAAIGEIGMDFWYKWVKKDEAKKDEQRVVFRRQLELAKELGLPVVIHSRGTWGECFETAKKIGISKAVFHWYSGPLDVLDKILGAGYLISAAPSLAVSPQSREAVAHAPIEQVLIETDSPVFFQISSEEGFTATPKEVWRTLRAYCELKKTDEQKSLSVFNQNAKEFFGMKYSNLN